MTPEAAPEATPPAPAHAPSPAPATWRLAGRGAVLGLIFYSTVILFPGVPGRPLPRALTAPVARLQGWRVANAYGLFAVMTRRRYELEFQGSDDGVHFKPYGFAFKPQDPRAAPGIYAPYQPRFDWDLWFASLDRSWRDDPWVLRTEALLLRGQPQVLALFARDPFPTAPPKEVRVVRWRYLVHHLGPEGEDRPMVDPGGPGRLWPGAHHGRPGEDRRRQASTLGRSRQWPRDRWNGRPPCGP